jgi:hypothetical protein
LPSSCKPPTVVAPCIDSASSSAALVYIRSGDLNVNNGAALDLNSTTVYEGNGGLALSGTSVPFPIWTAPSEGPFGCAAADASCVGSLALWSDNSSSSNFTITGGSTLDLQGVFFAPWANPFKLTGGGTWAENSAQFVARQVQVSGGATLTLVPATNSGITLPGISPHLIR